VLLSLLLLLLLLQLIEHHLWGRYPPDAEDKEEAALRQQAEVRVTVWSNTLETATAATVAVVVACSSTEA
jgi:hypothetical protein